MRPMPEVEVLDMSGCAVQPISETWGCCECRASGIPLFVFFDGYGEVVDQCPVCAHVRCQAAMYELPTDTSGGESS